MTYDSGWSQGLTEGRRALLDGPAAFAALQNSAADAAAKGGESAQGFAHGIAAGGAEAAKISEALEAIAAKSLAYARQVAGQRFRALQYAVGKWGGASEPTSAARQALDAAELVVAMLDRRAAPALLTSAQSRYAVAARKADSLVLARST